MKIRISILIVIVAVSVSFFFGTTASEELGPFDKSNQRCKLMPALQCVGLREPTPSSYATGEIVVSVNFTVGEVVSLFTTRPFTEIQQLNGWKKDEVVPNTILPIGKMIVISGSI